VEGTRTFTNVGTYTAKVDGLADKNYTLDNAVGQKEISVSVTIRTVEAVWSGETDVVYDGAEHTLTATIADLSLGSDYTVTDASYTEAGDYEFTVELLNTNCQFADGTKKATVTLHITQPDE
jgi:hypothetical protein